MEAASFARFVIGVAAFEGRVRSRVSHSIQKGAPGQGTFWGTRFAGIRLFCRRPPGARRRLYKRHDRSEARQPLAQSH